MVLASEDVVDSNSFDVDLLSSRDRSLSYVNLECREKVFESVRGKFGRPRQQCSDFIPFYSYEAKDLKIWDLSERRDRFGQVAMNAFRKPDRRWSDALSENWENETETDRGQENAIPEAPYRNFDEDGVLGSETRISDIRENWRLRVMRENEEKESRSKKKSAETKKKPESIPEPIPSRKSSRDFSSSEWKYETGENDAPHDEQEKKGSLLHLYDKHWGVYNEQQEADSLNEPSSFPEPVSSPEPLGERKNRPEKFRSGKSFFGHFLTSRTVTPAMDYKEPFSQLWVILSTMYGQMLVILMLAFCLTEVMDNSVKLLTLQGVFLMYLYVGSIAVIICIYIWVLIDSCASLHSSDTRGLVPPTITTSIVPDREGDLRSVSVSKFGSLKKAHISRDRTSNTSFYLRVGAIAFGLGTLVFNGLEMAMHSMMEGSCLNDVVFVHPVLHGLFTFLQMHFLFVNSQVLVERFGLAARFGFMHLAATNLALWVRLIVWESGNEWTYFVHLAQNVKPGHSSTDIPTPLQLRGFPKFVVRQERDVSFHHYENAAPYRPISDDHISQVVSLHHCLNTNTLGQLWTSSMPFLYPFIIQFSLIAAAVTFVMGQNVAKDRLFFQKQKKVCSNEGKSCSVPTMHESGIGSWGVDCSGASKGLFLGLLCLVAGIVVIIIFLVVKEDETFPVDTVFWLTGGTLLTILGITTFVNIVGLVQIRKLSVIGRKQTSLDKILSTISTLGVQLYSVFGIVVGAVGIIADESVVPEGAYLSRDQKRHVMLLSIGAVQLIQSTMQTTFVGEAVGRTSLTRNQILTKPARQAVTYLMFANAVLWAFDTFVVQSWMSQELQLRFYGVLVWGVVSRIGLPLLVFFRFHSCVLLLEIWKKSYQSLHDPGN